MRNCVFPLPVIDPGAGGLDQITERELVGNRAPGVSESGADPPDVGTRTKVVVFPDGMRSEPLGFLSDFLKGTIKCINAITNSLWLPARPTGRALMVRIGFPTRVVTISV